jgi:hypothetical protein
VRKSSLNSFPPLSEEHFLQEEEKSFAEKKEILS